MSERGVFAIDRGIFDHPLLRGEPYTRVQVWAWLIAEAAWKARRSRVGGSYVDLERGQLAHSLRHMARTWQWTVKKVRVFLSRLKEDKMIVIAEGTRITLISIAKYDEYQRVSLPKGTKNGTAKGTTGAHEGHKPKTLKTGKTKKESDPENSNSHIRAVADATRPNAGKIFDEEFWPKYPKREGPNPKKPAREAFIAAVKSGHDPTTIVGGAQRFAASAAALGQVGTRFIAQAKTWLNQARWEDYQATAPPTDRPAYMTPPAGSEPIEKILAHYGKNHGQNIGTEVRSDARLGEDRPN